MHGPRFRLTSGNLRGGSSPVESANTPDFCPFRGHSGTGAQSGGAEKELQAELHRIEARLSRNLGKLDPLARVCFQSSPNLLGGDQLVKNLCQDSRYLLSVAERAKHDATRVSGGSLFDSELLERLHERRPGMSDRELLESMARMTRGRETLRRVQERNTLSEDEAIELGVKAVHEARRERRAAG